MSWKRFQKLTAQERKAREKRLQEWLIERRENVSVYRPGYAYGYSNNPVWPGVKTVRGD